MVKKILNTLATKVISSLLSFFLLVLTTRYLGAYGRGIISLVIASIGILALFSGFVGGTSLVYLIPKNNNRVFLKQASFLSYGWAFSVCLFGSLILVLSGSLPRHLFIHVLFLGILATTNSVNTTVLLSQEKISAYNATGLIQIAMNFSLFALLIALFKSVTVNSYWFSFYSSSFIGLVFAVFFLISIWKRAQSQDSSTNLKHTAGELTKFGFIAQLGNVIQYFNYRLSYFILNTYGGPADVGVYSVGVVLSEAVWLLSSSISLVLYSSVANKGENFYSKQLTVKLAKWSFLLTFLSVIILFSIPEKAFTFVFGKDFSHLKNVILTLGTGVVCFGFSGVLSHYFAGTGKYAINTAAASLGLIVTLVGNILLVPKLGYLGAGMTASLSYLVTAVFLIFAFLRVADVRLSLFKPNREDLRLVASLVKR